VMSLPQWRPLIWRTASGSLESLRMLLKYKLLKQRV
jgi:hypothetical protein